MYETMDMIAAGEAPKDFFSMLPQAGDEVRGHSNIKCAVTLACENVDSRVSLFAHGFGACGTMDPETSSG